MIVFLRLLNFIKNWTVFFLWSRFIVNWLSIEWLFFTVDIWFSKARFWVVTSLYALVEPFIKPSVLFAKSISIGVPIGWFSSCVFIMCWFISLSLYPSTSSFPNTKLRLYCKWSRVVLFFSFNSLFSRVNCVICARFFSINVLRFERLISNLFIRIFSILTLFVALLIYICI